jgi:hypothetical protein
MTPAQALKIDHTLASHGKVVAAYAALQQDAAYKPAPSIMDQLLGRTAFGSRLRAFRQQTQRPLRELLNQLRLNCGIRLPGAQLACWEQGFYIPSENKREVISALDTLYQANGELFAAWESEKPRQYAKGCDLAFATWPPRLQAQFRRLVDYKTTNPEALPEAPGGNRWTGAAAAAAFQDFCEQFFGFLVADKGYAAEDLSLTLVCDWRLVHGYFEWLRLRAQRANYTTYEFWRTSTLRGLYRGYFPHLADDAAEEAVWQNRLPPHAQVSARIAPGLSRPRQVPLETWSERWCSQVAQAREKAGSFQKHNTFDCVPYVQRVQPLLESNIGIAEIAAELSARVKQLPPRILCRKAAILCRRLAEAALLVARNLHPCSFLRLQCGQVTIVDRLKIALDIPESQLRNRGMTGGKDGVRGILPGWDCVHEALRRYIEEARPILLGPLNLRGNQDAGYFFIDSFSKRRGRHQASSPAGGPIGQKAFYHDIVVTLGYNAWAAIYLFAADAWRHDVPTDQIAAATQTTVVNAEITFGKVRGPEKTQRANATVAKLLSVKKTRSARSERHDIQGSPG